MENSEAYTELVAAEEDVRKVWADIDQTIKSAVNREFGEKLALELYAPLMDKAMKKSREALDKWLQEIRDLRKKEETLLQEKS